MILFLCQEYCHCLLLFRLSIPIIYQLTRAKSLDVQAKLVRHNMQQQLIQQRQVQQQHPMQQHNLRGKLVYHHLQQQKEKQQLRNIDDTNRRRTPHII
jgi:hypothetical protein